MDMVKPPTTPIKVAISIPSEGHTLPEAYDNHLVLAFHLGKMQSSSPYEFYWYTAGRLFTPMAREKLVLEALNAGMDYILMYDDDMLLPLDMVETMLEDVTRHPEIDILAPLAFMRNPPHYAVIYTTEEGYDSHLHKAFTVTHFVKNYPKDRLVECDAIGMGAVLIRLSMVRKMQPPYFFSTTGSGEDIYFCIKAKQDARARIFMDTRIKLGHLSTPAIIDEAYFLDWVKSHKHDIPDVPHKYLSYDK